jgi:hypothetical protein
MNQFYVQCPVVRWYKSRGFFPLFWFRISAETFNYISTGCTPYTGVKYFLIQAPAEKKSSRNGTTPVGQEDRAVEALHNFGRIKLRHTG